MKTKLSKKLLSVLLAALMVVTSVPLIALADSETDASTDPNVIAADNAMDDFDTLLATSGKAYKNVEPAYNAYVGVQKARDSYVYGTGTAAQLSSAVQALQTAQSGIVEFTGYTGNKVPTFADSSASEMEQYAGEGYNNILYTETASEINSTDENDAVHLAVTYSPTTVLLYDGINDTKMPVMMSGNLRSDKARYIYSCFPVTTQSASDPSNAVDHPTLQLTDYWRSGAHLEGGATYASTAPYISSNSGGTIYGTTADWDWNWWSNTYTPAYNVATGIKLAASSSHRSAQLAYNSTKLTTTLTNKFNYGYLNYSANVLQVVAEPAAYGETIYPYWYFCTGNDASNETVLNTLAPIKVLNYRTLTDAIATNGEKMKSIAFDNFSEGGLLEYIQAMDAATSFDPNTYFVNGDGFDACVADMKTVVRDVTIASVYEYDSTSYENLRDAMDAKMAAYNNGENPGYSNYDEFLVVWQNAQAVMDAVVTDGYVNDTAAQAAADALNNFILEVDFDPVSTTALESVIDTANKYAEIFTEETHNAFVTLRDQAIETVWGSTDKYKDTASALVLSDENQAIVDNYVTALNAAVAALRIDPDAYVQTSYGRYSLNSAIALNDGIENTEDYWNYGDFKTALDAANAYKAELATTDLTNYTKQYNAYIAQIENVVYYYEALEITFLKTPDGTVARTGDRQAITTLEDHKNSNGYNWYFDFEYPSTGILLLKTTHDAATFTYGTADVSFAIHLPNNNSKGNNALDGITISGTADANSEISSRWASSTPYALSDSEKETYAASLSHTVTNTDGTQSTFSLSNFRVTGEQNNDKGVYGTDAAGNSITTRESASDEFTKILSTVEGSSANPALGTVALQQWDTNAGNAQIVLTADMNVSVPATEKVELTAETLPELKTYTLSDTYFGVTYVWNTQPTVAYSGYAYLTSKTNDEMIYSVVQVLDVSNLFDLINMCNALMSESEKYTADSWSNFTYYLGEASKDFGYTNLTLNAAALIGRAQTRYTNLWNAYQALEIKDVPVTFNYKTALGQDTSKVINVKYGETLNSQQSYIDLFNEINLVNYTSADGLYTYSPDGTWTPSIDFAAPVTAATSYSANYTESINMADFTEFNAAAAALLAKLTDDTYSVTALNDVAAAIADLTYYGLTAEEQATYDGSHQKAIDAETAALNALADGLVPSELDLSAAKAAVQEAKYTKDQDVYDVSDFELTYTQEVTVVDGVVVSGLTYATQAEIDADIANLLNGLNKCVYTVYFNGTAVGTAEFGTPVIVSSNGTFVANVADMDSAAYDGDAMVAWSYSYVAPSREDSGATAPKYMHTAKSLGFIVKGDTYLTTAQAEEDEAGYVVKFVTNDGKVFDVQYTTTGEVTVPTAPTYAFYKFTGYDNGASAGDVITVTESTTITANYEAKTTTSFTISYYASESDWFSLRAAMSDSFTSGETVALSNPNAYCWTSAVFYEDRGIYGGDDFTVLGFGTEYSFKAYQDIDIVALTYNEYISVVTDGVDEVLCDSQGNIYVATKDELTGVVTYPEIAPDVSVSDEVIPIYDDNDNFTKFSMVGTVLVPEGYTIVEDGILFSSDQTADLILEKVGTSGIARMKSSTGASQFTINVKAPSSGAAVSFKYAAYAILKDADGNLTTVYSKSVLGSTQGF